MPEAPTEWLEFYRDKIMTPEGLVLLPPFLSVKRFNCVSIAKRADLGQKRVCSEYVLLSVSLFCSDRFVVIVCLSPYLNLHKN